MNAAASSRNGLGGFPSAGSQNEGYAIPIEKAIAIAKKIISKEGGANIHVGANRATIGVSVPDGLVPDGQRARSVGSAVAAPPGAVPGLVGSGRSAPGLGCRQGRDHRGLDDHLGRWRRRPRRASALMKQMVQYQPGDKVDVTWTDSSGSSHHATVTLGSGPPA